MTPRRANLNRIIVTAPWMTLVILLVFSQVLPNRIEATPEAARRKSQVAEAMADVPYRIGSWQGEDDKQVPPEAQKLLRPNAMLNRRYQADRGPQVNVLVVHCGDARDMIGHYPPICYPSAGWIEVGMEGTTDIQLNAGGRKLPVRVYGFRSIGEHGAENVIRIFNAFILPDGTVTREMDDINEQSERLAVSVQGVAQFQVITSSGMSLPDAVGAAEEILAGMSGMFDALQVKEGTTHGT